MTSSFVPAQTGQSRVFLIEGRARPDHRPTYMVQAKAGGVSQSFGDIEKIEVPDPNQYDHFSEVGTIRGAKERATITLTGRYARDMKSIMLRLARAECPVDVHVNLGACKDPSAYNEFDKKIILEDARLTNYSNEDLGALGSDERAKIDESVDISARDVYEIVEVTLASRGGDVVTLEVTDVTICDTASCGDCDDESSGCERVFATTIAAGGSPGTPADVVYSFNSGVTWYAHDVDSSTGSENQDGIACLGSYLFTISDGDGALHYVLKSEFNADGTSDPDFTQVTTGFVSGGGPLAVDVGTTVAFIVGSGGYIYSTSDVTGGVTVLDAGVLYTDNYNDVSALNDDFAVAVGDAGRIVKTENGTTWAAVTPSPVGVAVNFNAILVKTEKVWFVGTSTGQLYFTLDGGATWTEKTFSGSGTGVVRDIVASTDSVLYLSHDTATPKGRILRSSNGGYDWVVMPEGSGILPANDRINALAVCESNADFVVGVGLADDATDGFIIVGSD